MGDVRVAADDFGGCYVKLPGGITYISRNGTETPLSFPSPQFIHLSRCGTLLTFGTEKTVFVRRLTEENRPHGSVLLEWSERQMINGAVSERLVNGKEYLIIANQCTMRSLLVVDIATGQVAAEVNGGDYFNNAAVSPDRRWLGTVGDKATACFWQVLTRSEVADLTEFAAHRERREAQGAADGEKELETVVEMSPRNRERWFFSAADSDLCLVLRRTADLRSRVNNGCLDFTHDSQHYILGSRSNGVFWGSLYEAGPDQRAEDASLESDVQDQGWETRKWGNGEWWEKVYRAQQQQHCFVAASPREPIFFACSGQGVGSIVPRATVLKEEEAVANNSFLSEEDTPWEEGGYQETCTLPGGQEISTEVQSYLTPHGEVTWVRAQGPVDPFQNVAVSCSGDFLWLVHTNGLQRYTVCPPKWTEMTHHRFPVWFRTVIRCFMHAVTQRTATRDPLLISELALCTASMLDVNAAYMPVPASATPATAAQGPESADDAQMAAPDTAAERDASDCTILER